MQLLHVPWRNNADPCYNTHGQHACSTNMWLKHMYLALGVKHCWCNNPPYKINIGYTMQWRYIQECMTAKTSLETCMRSARVSNFFKVLCIPLYTNTAWYKVFMPCRCTRQPYKWYVSIFATHCTNACHNDLISDVVSFIGEEREAWK